MSLLLFLNVKLYMLLHTLLLSVWLCLSLRLQSSFFYWSTHFLANSPIFLVYDHWHCVWAKQSTYSLTHSITHSLTQMHTPTHMLKHQSTHILHSTRHTDRYTHTHIPKTNQDSALFPYILIMTLTDQTNSVACSPDLSYRATCRYPSNAVA